MDLIDAFQESLVDKLQAVTKQKDAAYAERNKLVLLIASIYDSWLSRHPEEDKEWEDDWRWIVTVDINGDQATWHIHDSEYEQFTKAVGVRWCTPSKGTAPLWDGHTTEEKYQRIVDESVSNGTAKAKDYCPVCGDDGSPRY
jgi:hypothetical protein